MAAQRHARSRGAPSSDRGMRERDRDRDRERERDRERDRDRDRERERERSGFFSERERGARGIGDGYKDKDKDLHVKERERERDRSRDRDRVREREREQGGRGVRRHPEAEGERRQSPSRGVVLGTAAQAMSAVIASPGSETASERAPQSVASQSAGKQGSKDTEREPGELSSGSRNEDGDRNQMDFVESKDRAVQGEEGSGRAAEAAPSPASGARSVMSKQPHSRGREAVGGGGSAGAPASGDTVNPVPAKKRKFSPIVWDLDDKSGARSRLSSASAAASSIARFGASQEASSQRASSQRLVPNSSTPSSHAPTTPASTSGAGLGPSQSASFASQTGRQSPPLPGRRTPPQSARSTPSFPSHHTPPLPGHHRSPSVTLSGERQTPTLSSGTPTGRVPAVTERDVGTSVSPLPPVAYSQGGNSPGTSLGDKEALDMPQAEPDNNVSTSPLESDDMPGQLPTAGSPSRMDEDDDGIVPPPITIAASRWAEETHTPEHVKSPQMVALKSRMAQPSSSLDSEDGRVSSDRDQGREASRGHSTSPEPGEYIREKPEDGRGAKGKGSESDGSVGHGSVGRESRENCDEEDEKELNKRELMELDAEGDVDEPEEQIPELDSESDDEAQQAPIGVAQRTIDMLKGCRSVDEFERLNKIDEGTYGVVYRARDRRTGEIVALKKVKMEKETEGFPMTSLREINVLLSFHHPSVVDVKEVVVGSNLDSIFMVMEYMEHDLKGLMENMKQPFSQSEVKCLMLQLFEGVKYLHDNWVLHRDLKTSNLLLNNRGELKICDFGLARQYGSPLKAYTHMVVTLWYRAPELLLGSKLYSTAIDMWSLGCIMAEFLAKKPLFNGETEIDQLDKIFKILGTPTETIWPDYAKLPSVKCNFVRQPYNRLREKFPPTSFVGRPALSESGFDLLNKLLTYDPLKRITAEEALKHSWFTEVPLPKAKEFMPTFPVRSEHERRLRRLMRSPDPLEEQRKRDLRQAELLFGVSG